MKLRKEIRGYEGLYEARTDGAIISMRKNKVLSAGQLGKDGRQYAFKKQKDR